MVGRGDGVTSSLEVPLHASPSRLDSLRFAQIVVHARKTIYIFTGSLALLSFWVRSDFLFSRE